ncbi:MAG: hypothetical protein ACFFCM_12720 [Promethearchaeota archaeon]
MDLTQQKILSLCKNKLIRFEETIRDIKYEENGILNSEMLLFVSLVDFLKPKVIIESGRSRGQSTKIMSEYFKKSSYTIHSIEYNKYSEDVEISLKRLQGYRNLKLHFGDSFELIPKLINEESCILIDGPKDLYAINLAIKILYNPLVKAVFIHDVYKNSPYRPFIEKMFKYTFFSDDFDFNNMFKALDNNCLDKNGHRFDLSSIATLGIIFQDEDKDFYNKKIYKQALKYYKGKRLTSRKNYYKYFKLKIKEILFFPKWEIKYERLYENKQIKLLNLLKKLLKIKIINPFTRKIKKLV